ncbi:MAG: hypothetical protein ABJN62_11380 [Halioglobus sp.]
MNAQKQYAQIQENQTRTAKELTEAYDEFVSLRIKCSSKSATNVERDALGVARTRHAKLEADSRELTRLATLARVKAETEKREQDEAARLQTSIKMRQRREDAKVLLEAERPVLIEMVARLATLQMVSEGYTAFHMKHLTTALGSDFDEQVRQQMEKIDAH